MSYLRTRPAYVFVRLHYRPAHKLYRHERAQKSNFFGQVSERQRGHGWPQVLYNEQ